MAKDLKKMVRNDLNGNHEITGEDVMNDIQNKSPQSNEKKVNEILMDLLSGEKDLDLKTEIHRPKEFAVFKVYGEDLKQYEGFEEAGDYCDLFMKYYLRNMFSFNRKSREEVIDALKGMIEMQRTNISLRERFTTNLADLE